MWYRRLYWTANMCRVEKAAERIIRTSWALCRLATNRVHRWAACFLQDLSQPISYGIHIFLISNNCNYYQVSLLIFDVFFCSGIHCGQQTKNETCFPYCPHDNKLNLESQSFFWTRRNRRLAGRSGTNYVSNTKHMFMFYKEGAVAQDLV